MGYMTARMIHIDKLPVRYRKDYNAFFHTHDPDKTKERREELGTSREELAHKKQSLLTTPYSALTMVKDHRLLPILLLL